MAGNAPPPREGKAVDREAGVAISNVIGANAVVIQTDRPTLLCFAAAMRRLLLSCALGAFAFAFAGSAWADKIAILPFTSPRGLPKPELDQVRRWTQEAATQKGHTSASESEMVSARAAVKDGTADTREEFVAVGKAAKAEWTLTGHVERTDYPPTRLPDGREEDGYTTYRVELEAAQVASGRVESLSREVLADEGPTDIAEMIGLLVRPEGISNAEIPWGQSGTRRPKPKPKPPASPPPAAPPPEPPPPPPARMVYGEGAPIALGLSVGFSDALVRPDQARGPSGAMPIGGAVGYALPDVLAGLELRANFTSQVIGPRAIELSAGARYAFAPIRGVRFFVGPEVLLGGHVALGAEKSARFLTHGSAFLAVGITTNVQAEVAGDLSAALGGSGTLVLGGGTARVAVRF